MHIFFCLTRFAWITSSYSVFSMEFWVEPHQHCVGRLQNMQISGLLSDCLIRIQVLRPYIFKQASWVIFRHIQSELMLRLSSMKLGFMSFLFPMAYSAHNTMPRSNSVLFFEIKFQLNLKYLLHFAVKDSSE